MKGSVYLDRFFGWILRFQRESAFQDQQLHMIFLLAAGICHRHGKHSLIKNNLKNVLIKETTKNESILPNSLIHIFEYVT